MNYLDLLRQRRAEQDTLGRFLTTVGGGVAESMVQQQLRAQQRAKVLMQQGESAFRSGQFEAAARVVPQLQEALQQGYDIKPVVAPPVGSPIRKMQTVEGPRPTPQFVGPMPGVSAPTGPEIGRSFESPQTRAEIRAGLMMEPPKMLEVGGAVLDPETRQWMVSPAAQTPQTRMEELQAKIENRLKIAEDTRRSQAERDAARRDMQLLIASMSVASRRDLAAMNIEARREMAKEARAARNVWVNMPDGTRKRVPDTVGLVSEPGPETVPARDDEGRIVGFVQFMPTPSTGKPVRDRPPGKRAVAKPLSPADLRNISDQALTALLMETPKAGGDTRILTRLIATQPELAKRHNDLQTQIRRSIMAERQQAAEEQNTGVRPIQVEPLPDLVPTNETKMQRIIRLMEEDKKARSGQRQGGAGR